METNKKLRGCDVRMKKYRKVATSELCHDCWCQVLTYLTSQADFFAVILSIKGLLQHIKALNNNCLSKVFFRLFSIPRNKVPYVKKLLISNLVDADTGNCVDPRSFLGLGGSNELGGLNDPTLNDLFDLVHNRFEKVTSLKVVLFKSRYGDDQKFDFEHITSQSKFSRIVGSLKYLDIQLSLYHVKFDENLPNLEFMGLSSVGLIHSHSEVQDVETNQDYEFRLEVNFKRLPKLRQVKLHGWSMKSDFGQARNNIISLDLNQTMTMSSSLSSFTELKTLRLGTSSIENISLIEHNNNLESLFLTGERILADNVRSDGEFGCFSLPIYIPFELKNLPNLKRIEILGGMSFQLLDEGHTAVIENLPSLEVVKFQKCHFPVTFKRTPSIKILEANDCVNHGIDLDSPEEGLNLEQIDFLESTIGNVMFSNFYRFKKLQSVIILRNGSEYFEEDYKPVIHINDMPMLKLLDIFDGRYLIGSIQNCPNLERIYFHPSRDICSTESSFKVRNLPNLRNIYISLQEEDDENEVTKKFRFLRSQIKSLQDTHFDTLSYFDEIYFIFGERKHFVLKYEDIKDFPSCEELTIQSIPKIEIICPDVDDDSMMNIEELQFVNCGDLKIKNMKNTKIIRWSTKSKIYQYPEVILEDCDSLEDVEVSVRGIRPIASFRLLNLQNCKSLSFGEGFVGCHHLVIQNTPIRILSMKLGRHQHFHENEESSSFSYFVPFHVTNDLFPVIEELRICYDNDIINNEEEENGNCISSISMNCERLKRITIDGLGHLKECFVRRFTDFRNENRKRLKEILIECFWVNQGQKDVMILSEYVELVEKKYGIKIDLGTKTKTNRYYFV